MKKANGLINAGDFKMAKIQKTIVLCVSDKPDETGVREVNLPKFGHTWKNSYPGSKWGHSQRCTDCGTDIHWDKYKRSWLLTSENNVTPKKGLRGPIPLCNEVKMDEALS